MNKILAILIGLAIIAFVLTLTLGAVGVNIGYLPVFGGVFVTNYIVRLIKS